MKPNIDYSLYLVTDREVLADRELCAAVEEAIKGGVTAVQLREKCTNSAEFYEIASKVKAITDKHNIPLIINDRLDIALAVNAAGVHLGQQDLPAKLARELIGSDKILGVSAATLQEAKTAAEDGADYIGVGAVFPTLTKQDARAVSLEDLKQIKKSVSIPVVAIGGINENNVEGLKAANIDGIAVISCILGKSDVRAAAELMKKLVQV
ncbi:thiamine phosphate synthase [Clostridium swellfunianum]|uniref:thiamine phosphate synthase n=1 Tax=Clostridium swellfunianum TaxID=1367462 RepID=UPI002030A9DE|nr:thiamine phosphate synthase [Clostridium swellfunianum]MCM0647765.1 thiamine phosphate synthase [Clostridium swellfunianum]